MTTPRPAVAPARIARLRRICLRLPGAEEVPAWTGTRWSVRHKGFAHVLHIEAGWPPAYARAAHAQGPTDVLTFRSPCAELNVFSFAAPPFFRPGWWPNVVGMVLDEATDWEEVEMLVVTSYRVLAPKRLLAAIDRRSASGGRKPFDPA